VDDVRVIGREQALSGEHAFSDATNQRVYDVSRSHISEL